MMLVCDSENDGLARLSLSRRPTALAQRLDRLRGVAGLHVQLALQLPEIGVVRLVANERIDLLDRLHAAAGAIAGDGARVACGQAGVACRIAVVDDLRSENVAVELGAHHVVAQLQLRRVFVVGVGAGGHLLPQLVEAMRRHRMAAHERVEVLLGPELLLGEALERRRACRVRTAGSPRAGAGRTGRPRIPGPGARSAATASACRCRPWRGRRRRPRCRAPIRRRQGRRRPSGRSPGW